MGALALGVPVVSHEAAPTAAFCLARMRELGVTNLATTPTLLRGIMALGAVAAGGGPARALREQLRRAAERGGRQLLPASWGVTVMDQYGSSEFGLPVGNFAAVDMEVKPGSMGRPLPGCAIAVVDDAGREVGPDGRPHRDGAAAGPATTRSATGTTRSGPRADPRRMDGHRRPGRRDADGYFWFEGRADDVIKSAGYRIGPFEVESAILEHPAVAEAAVVGKPDALRGHIVKAFVVLKPGRARGAGSRREIVEVVKTRVGRHQ